jgi:hypothetical protein
MFGWQLNCICHIGPLMEFSFISMPVFHGSVVKISIKLLGRSCNYG